MQVHLYKWEVFKNSLPQCIGSHPVLQQIQSFSSLFPYPFTVLICCIFAIFTMFKSSKSKSRSLSMSDPKQQQKLEHPGGYPPSQSLMGPRPIRHTGSAPPWCDSGVSSRQDFYRTETTQYRNNEGLIDVGKLPENSHFRQVYQREKYLEVVAEGKDAARDKYQKTYDRHAEKKAAKRGDPPQEYGGAPKASREWHNGAADHKNAAGEAWKACVIKENHYFKGTYVS